MSALRLTAARRIDTAPASGPVQSGPAISVDGVTKVYGPRGSHTFALDRISLEVAPGEFCCLVGASGCGKSTLLNLLAGLDKPAAGTVTVNGRTSLMFQESALFPWLSVRGNINLALRLAGVPKAERYDRASDLLRMVRLKGFGGKRPHELSGGMRQRVALARALAQDAQVLLMDEPFGALDAMTRDLLHDEVERVWAASGLTVVFVTHNVREAVRLGDRVVLLTSRPGRVAEEFSIDLPRPRRIDSAALGAVAGHITDRLRQEVRSHGR